MWNCQLRRDKIKRLVRVLNKHHFSLEQEKFLETLFDILFPIAAIVVGVGYGCGWHLDTLIHYSDAFISHLQATESVF